MRDRIVAWWSQQSDRELNYKVPTCYGQRSLHDVLDRMGWHAAQHTRQLIIMLESRGIMLDRPPTAADLAGLPEPYEVWDR